MDLDEAIKYFEEMVEIGETYEMNKGMLEEYRQLAEWLKELKAYRSRSEIPNTCGDAISRQAAIRAIEALQLPIMREESNYYQFKFSGMSEAREAVENLPSVTPQQRMGRWIEVIDESDSLGKKTWHHECSICGSDKSGWGTYKHCPDCGTKMEVEE